ncbi:MAG TPA: CoA pyrophosphatase [Saprospiraceae bacterium]|nr:CoA pyrophosphatase [Saprospiraceae bacterium]
MQRFIPQLGKALQQPLPGVEAQLKLAHGSRKELRGHPSNARKAAVLALFFPKETDWHLALIQRAAHDKDRHSGQISFPGGRHESADPDFRFTALRETEEEIGVKAENINILGDLSSLYIPVSNFLVHPYVGFVDFTPTFQPEPSEVDQVLELPFFEFLKEQSIGKTTLLLPNQIQLKDVPHFKIKDHVIWGATAMMMSELVTVAQSVANYIPSR